MALGRPVRGAGVDSGAAGDGALTGAPAPTLGVFALMILAFGMLMVALRHSRALVVQLREARGEVARLAAADERLRIARDLHDLLGHSLSLIVLKSERARWLADRDPARAVTEIGDIESVARSSLADACEAISGYRRRELGVELDGARAVQAAAGIDTTVRTRGEPLPKTADGVFSWVVRESVANVIRHAHATRCVIEIRPAAGRWLPGRGPRSRWLRLMTRTWCGARWRHCSGWRRTWKSWRRR
ncbi:sensor histidine kinase [Nonomuraea jiangxiensis]|uniref:Two-component system, NarL family, sensor histidine kinase DesK n=1 Tax=Nonomuraea jiangxiensis TaxID=633440 RepID=A0A1G9VQN2_9ACTN|nr:histidine kinase [Nonomuraea jiangxiensis]SDM74489.1 two-component system, NarL family, sensor histidine kinase DesK [Nonomuraea jiangxiensis]